MTATDQGAVPSRRIEEFEREISELKVRSQATGPEGRLLILGIVLLLGGLVLIAIAWLRASGTNDFNDQISYLISGGLGGVGAAIVGCALYVRTSMSRYLRYWLIRMVYEQRAQTDRIVDALENASKSAAAGQSRSGSGSPRSK